MSKRLTMPKTTGFESLDEAIARARKAASELPVVIDCTCPLWNDHVTSKIAGELMAALQCREGEHGHSFELIIDPKGMRALGGIRMCSRIEADDLLELQYFAERTLTALVIDAMKVDFNKQLGDLVDRLAQLQGDLGRLEAQSYGGAS